MNYSTGATNIITHEYQVIRLSEEYCPHKCPWCYEHIYALNKKEYDIPKIMRNDIRIIDMNLLCSPQSIDKIKKFKDIRVKGKVVYPG